MKVLACASCLFFVLLAHASHAIAQSDQTDVQSLVAEQAGPSVELAQKMWNWAELGYQEGKSSAAL